MASSISRGSGNYFKVVQCYSNVRNQNYRETEKLQKIIILETKKNFRYTLFYSQEKTFCSWKRCIIGKKKFTNITTLDFLGNRCRLNANSLFLCSPKFMSSGRKSTHYYDVLGLTPKATQNQIKESYYALSKKYHPDVASDKRSHELFTEINDAYQVLGNIQKRRLYDRGMFNPRGQRVYDEGDYTQSYKEKPRQSPFERGDRPPPPTGRSKIYNFDEFYKQHYNEVRERRSQELKEFKLHRERILQNRADYHQAQMSSPLAFSLCAIFIMMIILANDKYDKDKISQIRDKDR